MQKYQIGQSVLCKGRKATIWDYSIRYNDYIVEYTKDGYRERIEDESLIESNLQKQEQDIVRVLLEGDPKTTDTWTYASSNGNIVSLMSKDLEGETHRIYLTVEQLKLILSKVESN